MFGKSLASNYSALTNARAFQNVLPNKMPSLMEIVQSEKTKQLGVELLKFGVFSCVPGVSNYLFARYAPAVPSLVATVFGEKIAYDAASSSIFGSFVEGCQRGAAKQLQLAGNQSPQDRSGEVIAFNDGEGELGI
jgi:hypothetical protein